MSALIAGIRKGSFVVFGRAGMDMFADPPGTRADEADTFRADLGGSSANICAGLCKLGMQSALVTSVSDDAVGRFCTNRLRHYGVDTQYLKVLGGEARVSLAVYESCIEDFQLVIYRNNAVDFQVTEEDVDRVNYDNFGALITAGTVFAAEPSRSATFRAFENARAAKLPVIFDIDYRPYSWPSAEVASEVLTRAGEESDLIVGNDEEFGFMAGSMDKGLAKARELAAKGKMVIYKMGHEGALTFADGEEIRTGIYPVTAIKPNGAGDSFMAGLLAAIAERRPLKEAVLRGSACASMVVSHPGCAPAMPTTSQLNDFLAACSGPTDI
ncbi:5-dehydro-2-deoxygluconokinase [Celeribacter halophilus]|jgi:5-dehydro-2-deoxygluconokinase|uniref:5-dehydro-2-deoxygluconokinase n=1 Tax=Celeribacter halophilus TaxID=576117 RepID=A0AAW7XTG3_9RHOB|nr:5-dehydro-2-deoxygluconokinase [Celeribacter halophilus]MBU2891291.1 5-dehydro-2-deoxygluconokinase [Celeribacter halophilus]MDO6456045.1 5-dehydro-2-deoxygluconokinase [Celeribacter halophilus]MDO6512186.1 5-dehydro-2-deoxygluconokinase [Celeribacter halophilus]